MKKTFASILFVLSALASQASGTTNFYDQQARDIARRMTNQIELNELEYIQVKKYTVEKIKAVAEIRDMYQTNPMMMADRLGEVETLYANRITYLLNARQFENYLALNKSFKTEIYLIAENHKFSNLLK